MTKESDNEGLGSKIVSSIKSALVGDLKIEIITEAKLLRLADSHGLGSASAAALKEIKNRKAAGETCWVTKDSDKLVVHGEISKWDGDTLNTYSGPSTRILIPLTETEMLAL